MAGMFISYSRANRPFVEELVLLLGRVFSNHTVWFDEHISGGEDWWQSILEEIAGRDIFIYLLSNDSLESEHCQAEFREALRLQKLCLPVIIAPNTDISLAPEGLEREIRRREWVDLSGGLRDYQANAKLYAAIYRLLSHIPQVPLPPLSNKPVDKPDMSSTQQKRVVRKRGSSPRLRIVSAIVLVAVIGTAIIAVIGLNQRRPDIVAPVTQAATHTLNMPEKVATMDMIATLEQATAEANGIVAARATNYAVGTQQGIDQTATATLWTQTPAANITASEQAFRTRQDETAIAQAWTDTPTATNTPVPTATLTPTLPPEVRALTPVASNHTWTAVQRDFEGVEMVLVPAGCFEMGNDPLAYYWGKNERVQGVPDGGQQCFNAPFWIDRYEVTNKHFAQFAGRAAQQSHWADPAHPRENITWFEARDFCAKRGARLPTSAEWEYAARGPSNLIYPWGNAFIPGNVVYNAGDDFDGPSAEVGSKPGGLSWVGAYDMSGNVWEWTSTLHSIYDRDDSLLFYAYPYPYIALDGREDAERSDQTYYHVMRGGSWINLSSHLRAASVDAASSNRSGPNVGFRCVYAPE